VNGVSHTITTTTAPDLHVAFFACMYTLTNWQTLNKTECCICQTLNKKKVGNLTCTNQTPVHSEQSLVHRRFCLDSFHLTLS
jgi:hypothetical protein